MLRDGEGKVRDPVEDLDEWIERQAKGPAVAALRSPEREAAIANL